jgi:cobaltochelatase CobS
MSNLKIDAAARSRLRSAITSHAGWADYKRATGKGIADYQKEDYLAACHALKIDAETIVNSSNEGETMKKERTKDAAAVNALRDRFKAVESRLHVDKASRVDSIFRSINTHGGGMATDAQYAAIERVIIEAEFDGTTSTTAQVDTVPPVTVTANAAADPAGAALAALVAPHIAGQVTAQVMREVERRLENVSTVKIEIARNGATVGETTGHAHPMFATLCRALAARQVDGFAPNVWIAGPAGSGKTHAAKSFAAAADLSFHYNGALSMPHELLGFIDAAGSYHRTPFRDAFEFGGVYLFDEVDGSDNAALLALNAALANGRASFPDTQVERHADCHIVATANTWGLGATADYVGRSKIDAAFLSRFPVRLAWDYDAALEVAISGNADFARRVQAARERARAAGLKVLIDPRATMAGAALIAGGMTHDEAAALTYLANLSAEQKKLVEGRNV